MTEPKTLLCFGYGYSAQRLAARLPAAQWRVVGTSRTPGRAANADVLAFDGQPTAALQDLTARADAVLLSIPPDDAGDPALRAFASAFASRRSGWLGYLSTTGVYGDLGGRWAFEWTPPNPQSEQGRRRALAERQALDLPRPACIFRLPGIYGPGRSALDRLQAGELRRLRKPGQVFSRVHVEDIAAALALSMAAPNPGRIYNLCDDEPAAPEEVMGFAADLLGLTLPPPDPFDPAALSPMAQRFWAENKRVANARLKAEIGWRPLFPSYREGLTSIHRGDSRAQ